MHAQQQSGALDFSALVLGESSATTTTTTENGLQAGKEVQLPQQLPDAVLGFYQTVPQVESATTMIADNMWQEGGAWQPQELPGTFAELPEAAPEETPAALTMTKNEWQGR